MALFRLCVKFSFVNDFNEIRKTTFKQLKCLTLRNVKAVHTSNDGQETEHSNTEDKENIVRERILNKALEFVPEYGWSIDSLVQGAKVSGYPGVAHGMFPQGGSELVHYFCILRNENHSHYLKTLALERIQKKEFITKAVKKYLEMIVPYLNHWPQALGILSLPQNIPTSVQHTMLFSDNVWYYAGDKSTNINWYTKRATLAAVCKTTELVLIQDSSVEYENTWKFLDRRIEDLYSFSKIMQTFGGTNVELSNFIQGSFITMRNVAGLY